MLALGHPGDAIAIGASVVFSVGFGFVSAQDGERCAGAVGFSVRENKLYQRSGDDPSHGSGSRVQSTR
jgi:hypothetical protein